MLRRLLFEWLRLLPQTRLDHLRTDRPRQWMFRLLLQLPATNRLHLQILYVHLKGDVFLNDVPRSARNDQVWFTFHKEALWI